MNEKINIKQLIPLVVLILILGAGLIYYYGNKKSETSGTSDSGNGEIAIDGSGSNLQGSSLDNSGQDQSQSQTSSLISDGQTYSSKISEIRTPVNKDFEDLASKSKYTTLFSKEDIQNLINDTRKKTEDAITAIKALKIDPKFSTANSEHIKSLELLLDSINSFEKSRNTTDQTEAQKQAEQYAYDIDQSNAILSKIQIPQ